MQVPPDFYTPMKIFDISEKRHRSETATAIKKKIKRLDDHENRLQSRGDVNEIADNMVMEVTIRKEYLHMGVEDALTLASPGMYKIF